jgi:hypothetical protein
VWLWVRVNSGMPSVGDLTADTYVPPVPEMPAGGWFAEPAPSPATPGGPVRDMPQRGGR